MLRPGFLLIPAFLSLCALPAYAHGCGHHGNCGRAYDHDHDCGGCGYSTGRAVPNERTVQGQITEVIFLRGANADAAMVEVRVNAADVPITVRLSPAGFLKQHQFALKEGDTVTITGYTASAAGGQIVVATDVTVQGRTLRLRDRMGRPAW